MSTNNSRHNNPMLDMFCHEAQDKMSSLRDNLIQLRNDPNNQQQLKNSDNALMSLKGAAKIASLNQVFDLVKEMEAILTAASNYKIVLDEKIIDSLETAIVLIFELISAADDDLEPWLNSHRDNFSSKTAVLFGLQSEVGQHKPSKVEISPPKSTSLADFSMLELFRMEADSQVKKMSDGLMALENSPENPELLEELMRATHSLKGAARMVGLESSVKISHLMEDIFVAAQNNQLILEPDDIDTLLISVDLLADLSISTSGDFDSWLQQHSNQLEELQAALQKILQQQAREKLSFTVDNTAIEPLPNSTSLANFQADQSDNVVRVSAISLNQLQGLAGEALVETRWLASYSDSLLYIKKRQAELLTTLDFLREQLFDMKTNDTMNETIYAAHLKANECRDMLSNSLSDLESYDRRSNSLSLRLHRCVLQARMRPFSDGVQGFQRLVRELARTMDKNIKLDIRGLDTQVDRDILDKLQAPLNHMIRNAVDHGIETSSERIAAGKDQQGTIRLEAIHIAGMLSIVVQDDGRGIDLEKLRHQIIAKKMVSEEMAQKLSEAELLDFMFLPNFSTRDSVTELSGRGVGLDVVHKVVQELRGQIRSSTELNKGTKFQFKLPLTLSVVRALVVAIAGEPYAFPLARIDQTCKLDKNLVETMEGRLFFKYGETHIGLITAHQILELKQQAVLEDEISIVILSDRMNKYGLVVDEFLGERNLVVHTLDPRLGKVQDISSASLTEQGEPLLIFDVDDLFRSIDLILSGGRLDSFSQQGESKTTEKLSKRVLIVDDSITVREVERNLLQSRGYSVEVAVDGMDAWNAARTNHYDLIVSDIDMPRMNGFELVAMLKGDERLSHIPIIIVSYKDREKDRQRGLEVGADYYLTKGSFHDDTLVDAVIDLIGES